MSLPLKLIILNFKFRNVTRLRVVPAFVAAGVGISSESFQDSFQSTPGTIQCWYLPTWPTWDLDRDATLPVWRNGPSWPKGPPSDSTARGWCAGPALECGVLPDGALPPSVQMPGVFNGLLIVRREEGSIYLRSENK